MPEQGKKEWALETLKRVEQKMERVSARSAHKIPYTTRDGVHDDRSDNANIAWWTNGFWGGMMWQLYALTGKTQYRQIAEENEQELDRVLMDYNGLDHDNGFRWLPTAVADYRLTGNPQSRNRGLLAAENLAGRYNCAGKFIRAWNDWEGNTDDHRGWAIIDCMMNLPLLYWASEETGDPRFCQIAVNHANTAAEHFIRPDGSVNHIIEFDFEAGGMIKSYGGQGCAVGSSWTRGQAWGLYGFTLSYLHTKDPLYLESGQRIADYFVANIPESGLIPVDFRQPQEVTWEDSTAAAIAACGLIELARAVTEKEADQGRRQSRDWKENREKGYLEREDSQGSVYMNTALDLLETLARKRVNWNDQEDDLLTRCTAAYHDAEHEYSIIYGDYYFLEALMKLTGEDLFIW
ncbi:MAG: glycoside hydrolase family 88 protein [Clostridiales bacterium]|nr:glycoside hydrolase family 88 protein [Clostridiales bacterium]